MTGVDVHVLEPTPRRLSVIVVSYNTAAMTLECLRSLVAETSTPFELLVVDNASSDGSADAIRAEFPQAVLLAEVVNHGFARANNLAAARATGDYLLLLNPDTVVLDAAVDRLMAFADSCPDCGIWGGRTLHADRTLNPASCWRRMTVWSTVCRVLSLDRLFAASPRLNPEAYGGWGRDSERDVDIVSGCLFLIRRDLWERLGGFDTRFVMYGEEADLCLRARRLGVRPRVTPTATIVHYGGASETVRSAKHVKLLQAKITLAELHMSPVARWATTQLLRAWPLSRWGVARAGAALRRSAEHERVANAWREVWRARSTWWHGYPGVGGQR